MNPSLEYALRSIADFLTWQHRFRDVEGFLHDLEGYTLLQLAATGGGTGAVVEIGSYLGRSTAFLAAGSKGAGRERVVAVDHFRGSPEHQAGQPFARATLAQEGTTFRRFQSNLRRLDLDAGRGSIRLLFIDGDHSYEESKRDFELWSRFVVPRGLICFHDIRAWPGVTQFYDELLRDTKFYREVVAVVSLRVIEKLPTAPESPAAPR